jgi:NitT/TauT family transport system permease protein
MNRPLVLKAMPWIFTIALLLVWEGAAWLFAIPVYILPAPTIIAASIIEYWPAIWKNSLQTLYTTLLGFLLAVVGGMALGLAVGWSRFIYAGLYPLMIGFNAIPRWRLCRCW